MLDKLRTTVRVGEHVEVYGPLTRSAIRAREEFAALFGTLREVSHSLIECEILEIKPLELPKMSAIFDQAFIKAEMRELRRALFPEHPRYFVGPSENTD